MEPRPQTYEENVYTLT